jgi:hypothetical protein
MACLAVAAISADSASTGKLYLAGSEVVVGDVLECTSGEEAYDLSFESARLFGLPAGVGSVVMDSEELITLIRRRVPGLSHLHISDFSETVTFFNEAERSEASKRAPRKCFELAVPIEADAPLFSNDVTEVICDANRSLSEVGYEASSGLVRALTGLNVGEYLGAVMLPDPYQADRGDLMQLTVSIGPVKIQREVRAMQPISSEQRAFVEDSEGDVLLVSARLLNPVEVGE